MDLNNALKLTLIETSFFICKKRLISSTKTYKGFFLIGISQIFRLIKNHT